ncbi:hypothetical protein ES703_48512 [subsurface metagenome]
MQPRVGGIIVSPYQQIAPRGDGSYSRIALWNSPLSRNRQVVRQVHPTYINSIGAVVVELDPVIILALRVPDTTAIGGHKFIDYQRYICLVPLVGQQGKITHIDLIIPVEVGWAFRRGQPLLGKNVDVQEVDLAVPVQVTHRTFGLHSPHGLHRKAEQGYS